MRNDTFTSTVDGAAAYAAATAPDWDDRYDGYEPDGPTIGSGNYARCPRCRGEVGSLEFHLTRCCGEDAWAFPLAEANNVLWREHRRNPAFYGVVVRVREGVGRVYVHPDTTLDAAAAVLAAEGWETALVDGVLWTRQATS